MTDFSHPPHESRPLPRALNLAVETDEMPSANGACEITEYDDEAGWQQWQDSVFIQEFQDSVINAPAPSCEGTTAGVQGN